MHPHVHQGWRRRSVLVIIHGLHFFKISSGLNLTACSNVVLLEPWWNPAVKVRYHRIVPWGFSKWFGQEQAFDRVHRIGQLLPVSIYKLVVQGTVEERMIKVSLYPLHLLHQ